MDKNVLNSIRMDVEEIHDMIIDFSGGEKGVRDLGGLEHAIYSIFNIDSIENKPFYFASKIYYMLATRHYFVDGNKRTAHILAKTNLLIFGGFHLKVNYKEALTFIIDIARDQKSLKEIERWVEKNSVKVNETGDLDLDKYIREDLEQIKKMDH